MKQVLLLVLCLLSSISAYAVAENQDQHRVVICDKNVNKDKHVNRAPSQVPIECTYYSNSQYVEIILSSGADEANVLLTNMISGEMATVFGGSVLIVPIPSNGYYLIEITLSNGREYYGTFETSDN